MDLTTEKLFPIDFHIKLLGHSFIEEEKPEYEISVNYMKED